MNYDMLNNYDKDSYRMILNPLKLNDWPIRKFVFFVISIQLLLLALIILERIGISIPVLLPIIAFIYLCFIPGYLALRIFKLHNLSAIENLLYSVALSLTFNMFLGVLINVIYPFLGIITPLTLWPILLTWTFIVLILCAIAYFRDKRPQVRNIYISLHDIFSPTVLFFTFLPLLAIIGTQFVNIYSNNIVLLVLIALIAVIMLITIATNIIDRKYFPFIIYTLSLALLLHCSMISQHLNGWDIFHEYHNFSLVNQNGIWDTKILDNYNAMLSITILPTVFSEVMLLDGELILKIVYQILYALVPLGLYLLYSRHFSGNIPFTSVIFFISLYVFFLVMPSLTRQMIAELYCVLIVLLITEKNKSVSKKTLLILFCLSLVVSHYSLSYIYIGFIFICFIVVNLLRKKEPQNISLSFLALFIVSCFSWYIYISSSAPFTSLINIGEHIYTGLSIEFLNPASRRLPIYASPNALHFTNRIFYYSALLFLAVGAINLMKTIISREKPLEYPSIALGNYFLLASCIVLPFFSEQLGTERMFHIAIIIIAPYGIKGIEMIVKAICRLINFVRHSIQTRLIYYSAGIFITIFFLFNSGFIFEVIHDPWVTSLPLSLSSSQEINSNIDTDQRVQFFSLTPVEQEIYSARWLSKYFNSDKYIFATVFTIWVPAIEAYTPLRSDEYVIPILPPDYDNYITNGYLFLGNINVTYQQGMTDGRFLPRESNKLQSIWPISSIDPVLNGSQKIYTNGKSENYWVP